MKYQTVNDSNINILYKLNKQLAIDENQSFLFTGKKKDYVQAFICKNPIVFGILIYKENKPIGFIIYINKFATYLASKVLFIEDIYLKNKYQTKKKINELLQYMINKANIEKYSRLEMRVLNKYNLNKSIIKQNGFNKIKKWDTYRFEQSRYKKTQEETNDPQNF